MIQPQGTPSPRPISSIGHVISSTSIVVQAVIADVQSDTEVEVVLRILLNAGVSGNLLVASGAQVFVDVSANPKSQRSHFPGPIAAHPHVVQLEAQTTTHKHIHICL